MTNEELVVLIQAGDHVQENLGQLYQQNRNFIYQTALPFSGVCEMEDLLQEAYFGIVEAANRYDPTRGAKFLTYAESWIRQVIQRYCENNGRMKRLPAYMVERISKYQKFRSDFRAITQGEEPTDDEYCRYLDIKPAQLKNLRKSMVESDTLSFELPVPGTEGLTVGDTIPDDFDLEGAVCDSVGADQAKAVIWGAVADLGGKKAAVIEGQYLNHETYEELSQRLDISISRVQQIKKKALNILRTNRGIKEAAEIYGYHSSYAYHGGLRSFRDSGSSVTERLAIKHLEAAEARNRMMDQAKELNASIPVVADRMRKTYLPIGVRKLEELNAEIQRQIQEIRDVQTRKGTN